MAYLVLAFATWRISSLLINEDGPALAFTRLRVLVGVRYNGETFQREASNNVAGVFACIWCMSVWVGLALTVAYWFFPATTIWLCLPLALSAVAILIDKATG